MNRQVRWAGMRRGILPDEKNAISKFVLDNFVNRHGLSMAIGSGDTPLVFFERFVEEQENKGQSYDATILTTSGDIFDLAEKKKDIGLYVHSPGGEFNEYLYAWTGPMAAYGINNPNFIPDLTIGGVFGIAFSGGQINIGYKFPDEIEPQRAFLTRPTQHRIVVLDHTKLGAAAPQKARLSAFDILGKTDKCSIVVTEPQNDAQRAQLCGCEALMTQLATLGSHEAGFDEVYGKEFELIVIDKNSKPIKTYALSKFRTELQSSGSRNGSLIIPKPAGDTPKPAEEIPESAEVPDDRLPTMAESEWFDCDDGGGPYSYAIVAENVDERGHSPDEYKLCRKQSKFHMTFRMYRQVVQGLGSDRVKHVHR